MGTMDTIYTGQPTTVTVEASWEAIHKFDLDQWENEHLDHVENVISVRRGMDNNIVIETVRSIEALKRGEANAGRMTMTIPAIMVEAIHVNDRAEVHLMPKHLSEYIIELADRLPRHAG